MTRVKLTDATNAEYTRLTHEAARLVDAIHDGDAAAASKLEKVRARRKEITDAISARYGKHVPLGWQ